MADNSEQNPWTRPGWIISAVVVAVILVLGVVVTITTLRGGDDDAAPTDAPSSNAPTGTPTVGGNDPGDDSVCGIGTVQLDGSVTEAPDAQWSYEGTTAYPTSAQHGPGLTTDTGIRTCFEHTPAGAVFMVANAAVNPADVVAAQEWAEYAIAPGPFKEQLLNPGGETATAQPDDSDTSGMRLELRGFRVLDYSGDTARVDLGVAFFINGQESTASAVYELVWTEGDWKISSESENAFDFAAVPDLNGYIPWSAP